jgi:hypothetical protein
MKTLTLFNDFHNTSVHLLIDHKGTLEAGQSFSLTPRQVKRAKQGLCVKGCLCSGSTGARSRYHEINGQPVQLIFNSSYNPETSILDAVIVHVESIIP